MKKITVILFVSTLYLASCNSSDEEHGHEHNVDGTHATSDDEHAHGEDSHDHREKHEQEDFVVGEDSTTSKQKHSHEEGHGHNHDH